MSSKSCKLLYIAGAGRSGSTLLSRMLGQFEGFAAPGELYYLWQEGFAEERKCECGGSIPRCDFWSEVLKETERRVGRIDPAELLKLHHGVARTRHSPLRAVPGLGWLREVDESYAEVVRALYSSLAVVTNAAVIVDGSKLPSFALVLREFLQVDLRVLHLVRDPRAVAYSWRRKRHNPASGRPFGRISPARSAILWNVWNVLAERMKVGAQSVPYLRIRYEDFTACPRETLWRILNFLEESRDIESVVEGRTVRLAGGHSVGGNPNRFRTGSIPLRPDRAWLESLDRWPMLTVSALTLPLLLRYGYPIRRPSEEAANPSSVRDSDPLA